MGRALVVLAALAHVRLADTTYCEWHLERFRGRINYTDDPWSFQVDSSCTSLSFSTYLFGGLDDAAASALAAVLEGLPQLAELSLSWNNIGDVGAASLAASLKHCPKLSRLDLAWNTIGDQGMEALGEALKWLPDLEDLSVFWNTFGPSGATALLRGLEKSRRMKRLNLAWNNIGDAGAIELANSFQFWPSLLEVSLAWSNVGSAGIRAIAAALPRLTELQDLRVKWNEFDSLAGAALADAVAQIEVSRGGGSLVTVNGLTSAVLEAARNSSGNSSGRLSKGMDNASPMVAVEAESSQRCSRGGDQADVLDEESIDCTTRKCHALVLGNANYTEGRLPQESLAGPTAVAKQLRALGFTVSQLADGARKQMRKALKDYTKNVKPGEVSVVYFFGHALQRGGENYFLPIDFPQKAKNFEEKAVTLSSLLDALKAREAAVNALIVDACHQGPLGAILRAGDKKGLAVPAASFGALIAFSAAPGTVPDTTSGEGTPCGRYTHNLLSQLKEPRRARLEEVLGRVRRLVAKESENKQVPWEASSLTVNFVIGSQETSKVDL